MSTDWDTRREAMEARFARDLRMVRIAAGADNPVAAREWSGKLEGQYHDALRSYMMQKERVGNLELSLQERNQEIRELREKLELRDQFIRRYGPSKSDFVLVSDRGLELIDFKGGESVIKHPMTERIAKTIKEVLVHGTLHDADIQALAERIAAVHFPGSNDPVTAEPEPKYPTTREYLESYDRFQPKYKVGDRVQLNHSAWPVEMRGKYGTVDDAYSDRAVVVTSGGRVECYQNDHLDFVSRVDAPKFAAGEMVVTKAGEWLKVQYPSFNSGYVCRDICGNSAYFTESELS